MNRLPLTLGTLGILGLTAAIVFTEQPQVRGQAAGQNAPADQAPPAPPPPTNLQVLPKTTTAPEVLAVMENVSGALGVQCNYCHIAAPPAPAAGASAPPAGGRGGPPPLDFASDDKQEKKTARMMFRLVKDLNATVATAVSKPAGDVVQVQCVTCHRGVTKPAQLSNVLSQTMLTKGESTAAVRYRDLRTQYYGSQAYDFTERILVGLAQQSLAANKVDDALAWSKLNLEFYPESAQSLVLMSQAHLRKNDKAAAIKDLEQAVTLDPANAEAKRQLDQIKAQVAVK